MLQYTILDTVKRPFVIYKDTFTNQYCLEPRRGLSKKKAMIISLPRSGVHLMQEIFSSFDMFHVRVNHEKNNVSDFRFLSDTDRIKLSRLYDNYMLPFNESHKWIINGQFTHNHLKYDSNSYVLLRDSDYLMYLLKRDLRSCVISHARQKQHDNLCLTDEPSKLMAMYIALPFYKEILEMVKLMMPWFENKLFDEIKYEDISGQNGVDSQYAILNRLFEDFEIKNTTLFEVIDKCVNCETFTHGRDMIITKWEDYWNDTIEKWFVDVGFGELNKKLGYL